MLGDACRDDRVGRLQQERAGTTGQDDKLAIDAPSDAAGPEQADRLVRRSHPTIGSIAGS